VRRFHLCQTSDRAASENRSADASRAAGTSAYAGLSGDGGGGGGADIDDDVYEADTLPLEPTEGHVVGK